LLAREQGLTIDRLVGAEVVLANGSVVVADEHRNRELFWAVRGAGANFGVVSSFDFVVDEVDEIGLALMTHVVDDPASFLVAFGEVASSAPRDTTAELLAGPGSTGPLGLTTAVVVDSADHDTIAARTKPFLKLAPIVQRRVLVTPCAGLMNLHPAWQQDGRGEPVGHSGLLNAITPAFAAEAAALLRSGSSQLFQVRTLGGATADMPPEATAFAHREARFQVNALDADARELDGHWERIRPHLDGIYLPFETDRGSATLGGAFPRATLVRLRALKHELDPHNLFRDNFNVDPAAANTDEPELRDHTSGTS
jgi:FAD/FMN-containing dehydrogenase